MPSSFLNHSHRQQYQSRPIDVPLTPVHSTSFDEENADCGLSPYNSFHLGSFMSRLPPRHIEGLERHPDAPAPFSLDFFPTPSESYVVDFEAQQSASASSSQLLTTKSTFSLNERQEDEETEYAYTASDFEAAGARQLSIAEELERAWQNSPLDETTQIMESSQSFISAFLNDKSHMTPTSAWSMFSSASVVESDAASTPELEKRTWSAFSSDSSSGSEYSEPTFSEIILFSDRPTALSQPSVDSEECHHDYTSLGLNSNAAPLITATPLKKVEPLSQTSSTFSDLSTTSSTLSAAFSKLVRRFLRTPEAHGPENF